MKRLKGAITIEATIVLPIYILLMTFILNFLNMFYMKTVVQCGLNNVGTTMSQYCYAIDLTLGIDKLTLQESTSNKAAKLESSVNRFMSSAQSAMQVFDKKITIDTLVSLVKNAEDFVSATKNLKTALSDIKGEDVKNYLFASAAETGGTLLVKAMVDKYLDDMKVDRDLLDGDIEYEMYIDNSTHDLVFVARYLYKNKLFSLFTKKPFYVEQQVAVHPWIGGSSAGLRKSK